MLIFALLFCLYQHVNTANRSGINDSSKFIFKGYFWEVRPFIFYHENGELDGIIPKIFEMGQKHCWLNKNTSDLKVISFSAGVSSREYFMKLLQCEAEFGNVSVLNDIKDHKAVFLPIVGDQQSCNTVKNFRKFQLYQLSGIAVIVPRYLISLPHKILRGIVSCQQIFYIAFLLSAVFGTTIWVIERLVNEDFPKSFLKGTGTGIWWSIVSMTTVGYGDVVPRTLLGRLIALCWLLIGVLIGCLMTATMTDVVAGVNDLTVHGRRVSVLQNSFEEKVVTKDYNAIAVPAKSYLEVLGLVRQGKVFAGMIAADIAAWYQHEIHDSSDAPLRIIQILPANLFINGYFSPNVSANIRKLFACMYTQRDEVYAQPFKIYQKFCHIEKLYIGTTIELFKESLFIQLLFGCICAFFIVGLFCEFLQRLNKQKEQAQHTVSV